METAHKMRIITIEVYSNTKVRIKIAIIPISRPLQSKDFGGVSIHSGNLRKGALLFSKSEADVSHSHETFKNYATI